MRAVSWHGKEDIRVETFPDPQIVNPRDAIVKVSLTAICGSDLHLYAGRIPTMQAGDILGHEFMGEVVAIGREVTNLKVGDRVVVPFTIACGGCYFANTISGLSATIQIPMRGWWKSYTVIPPPDCSGTRICWEAMPADRRNMCACPSPTSGR